MGNTETNTKLFFHSVSHVKKKNPGKKTPLKTILSKKSFTLKNKKKLLKKSVKKNPWTKKKRIYSKQYSPEKMSLGKKKILRLKKKRFPGKKKQKKKHSKKKKFLSFTKFSELLFFSLGTQIQWFTVYAAKNKVISNNHNKVITVDIQILILHARLPLHPAGTWQSCRWGQVPSTSPLFPPKNPPEAQQRLKVQPVTRAVTVWRSRRVSDSCIYRRRKGDLRGKRRKTSLSFQVSSLLR